MARGRCPPPTLGATLTLHARAPRRAANPRRRLAVCRFLRATSPEFQLGRGLPGLGRSPRRGRGSRDWDAGPPVFSARWYPLSPWEGTGHRITPSAIPDRLGSTKRARSREPAHCGARFRSGFRTDSVRSRFMQQAAWPGQLKGHRIPHVGHAGSASRRRRGGEWRVGGTGRSATPTADTGWFAHGVSIARIVDVPRADSFQRTRPLRENCAPTASLRRWPPEPRPRHLVTNTRPSMNQAVVASITASSSRA